MGDKKTVESLSSAERNALLLLSRALGKPEEDGRTKDSDRSVSDLTREELQDALAECKKQACFCLAAEPLMEQGNLDAQPMQEYFRMLRHNMEIQYQHHYLHELMTKAGIPYMILKGAASASYYPEPSLRQMGDVDFLVAPEDVERASQVLVEDGFQPWNEEHICHIVFYKKGYHLEMHFEPAGIPNGEPGRIIREYLTEAITTAETETREDITFQNPSPFFHGLVMLLHMQHHLLAEGIGLRHLCDWAVFVDHFTEEEFVQIFRDKLTNCGLWCFARQISLAAHLGLQLPYRPFMGDERKTANALLEDILHGGNFGRKDESRSNEALFISNRGKDGVSGNRFTQFIRSVNQIIYTNWPIAKKHKLLLPFFWVYIGLRRGLRELTGRRESLHLTKAYQGSRSRKELYRKLHLFEIES